jgi:hypothetical protein
LRSQRQPVAADRPPCTRIDETTNETTSGVRNASRANRWPSRKCHALRRGSLPSRSARMTQLPALSGPPRPRRPRGCLPLAAPVILSPRQRNAAELRGPPDSDRAVFSATEIELAVAFGHWFPAKRQDPGEQAVPVVQAGNFGENPLWSPDHPAAPDIVGRAVPGAHQAAVFVDAASGQVGAEVTAPTRRTCPSLRPPSHPP